MQTLVLKHAIYHPASRRWVEIRPRDGGNQHHQHKYNGAQWIDNFRQRLFEPASNRMLRLQERKWKMLQNKYVFKPDGQVEVHTRRARQQTALMHRLKYDAETNAFYLRLVPDCVYSPEPVQYFETRQDISELVAQAFGTDFETLGYEIQSVPPHCISGYYDVVDVQPQFNE
jgi:hypothetical protein